MTHDPMDARLAALLTDRPAVPDRAFADRVVALAAHDLAVRRWQRTAIARVGRETLALVAVLVAFVLLARATPASGGMVPLASPAMLGLAMLLLWGVVAVRPAPARR